MSRKVNGKIRGIQNGWFTETETMWPGQRFSIALEVRTCLCVFFPLGDEQKGTFKRWM
jgi:hypothetical protein